MSLNLPLSIGQYPFTKYGLIQKRGRIWRNTLDVHLYPSIHLSNIYIYTYIYTYIYIPVCKLYTVYIYCLISYIYCLISLPHRFCCDLLWCFRLPPAWWRARASAGHHRRAACSRSIPSNRPGRTPPGSGTWGFTQVHQVLLGGKTW